MIVLDLYLLALGLLTPCLVYGQTSNAICEKKETNSFLFNSYDESPCIVWSKLQSLCLPADRFINVPPLADRTWGYNPVMESEKDSLCQCSVVAYALMAGCSWCQVGDSSTWVTEERWRQDCTSYNNTSVSFAQIVLPLAPYVFQPWKDGRWDATSARAALGAGPANVAPTVASTTLFRSFTPHTTASHITSSPSASSSASAANPDDASHDNAVRIGAIIGGVVGGLAILLASIMTFRHWRKQNKFQESQESRNIENIRGVPQGLPPYYDRHASGPAGGLFAMLTGGKHGAPSPEEKSKKDRISRWSEGFFINPRKAPKPKNRYTTTSERRRNKSLSSDTDGSSFMVLNSRRGSDGTLMGATSRQDENQGRILQEESTRHPFALSPGFEPSSPYRSSITTPRKAIPIPPPPRMSFADRWSDQSSVFTFATSKNSRETLPSFSTSVKEIKGHRKALAKTVADREAAERDREDKRWPDELAGESTPEIILGESVGRPGKKKSKKVREVDESGVRIKKKKKKKRSSNTPGYSAKRSSVVDNSLSQTIPRTRRNSSLHSLAPSDMPKYANKPLPPPPNILTRGSIAAPASIDFSVRPPMTPASAKSPLFLSSFISPRRVPLDTPAINHRQSDIDPFSRVETARMTAVTVDFPSPSAYASTRPNSTEPLSVSRASRGRERSIKSRVVTADFTQSPHPTLPSLYEPRTGAGVYDVPAVPRHPGGRIGNGEVISETGSPISRYPISTLQVHEDQRI